MWYKFAQNSIGRPLEPGSHVPAEFIFIEAADVEEAMMRADALGVYRDDPLSGFCEVRVIVHPLAGEVRIVKI